VVLINFPRVNKQRKEVKKDFKALAKKLLPPQDDDEVYDSFAHTITNIQDDQKRLVTHDAYRKKYFLIIDDPKELSSNYWVMSWCNHAY
jgi:hypothetical protein